MDKIKLLLLDTLFFGVDIRTVIPKFVFQFHDMLTFIELYQIQLNNMVSNYIKNISLQIFYTVKYFLLNCKLNSVLWLSWGEMESRTQIEFLDKTFIIKGFRTIVFIFIVISTTFLLICPPAFFRCLSNSGTFTELRNMSFIKTMGVTFSDSVSHNRGQVLSIPVLLLACSEDWTSNLQMMVSLEA